MRDKRHLLHMLDLLEFEVAQYWPVLLAAAGLYVLWARSAGRDASGREIQHER